MTPKRYFAFGCITLLIQGAVLASQNSTATLPLDSGSAMGSQQAVNIAIAMPASVATTVADPAQKIDNATQKSKPIEAVTPSPVTAAEPAKPQRVKTKAKTKAKPKTPQLSQKKAVTQAAEKQPVEKAKLTHEPAPDSQQVQPKHNQSPVNAKQGVTQQAVTLSRPTFAAPPTQPYYPKKSRQRGQQGTAMIEVMFNQIGEQLSLTLVDSSGYGLLDKAALKAVKKWQFAAPSPQTAYVYTVRVPVRFKLN
ncbi:TonB family protein [Shewanella sp.]|nr:TonB family protein [Shewanella sp.]